MSTVPVLLIDGNNMLHRAHWVAKNAKLPLRNAKGIETGCLFTFLKTLKTCAKLFKSNKIFIAWDTKLTTQPNFRKTLTEGTYKGTRDHARNKEVYDTMTEVLTCTRALGIKNIFPGSLEADDVISWLCKTVEGKKIIVSVDSDFAQLVTPDVTFYNPIKKLSVTPANFEETFKVTPKEYIYYKAIVGDTSDNINGLEGFGKIKGIKLAKAFASNQEEIISPYKTQVEHNLKLVDLSYGLQENPAETDLYMQQYIALDSVVPDFVKFKDVCVELEFNSILEGFNEWKTAFGKTTTDAIVDFCKLFG